ncbi:Rad1/Rec1/Rad17 [Hyaloraphidium curvatum]|nr:Rad1/Rec1/Rad17 [Hyaloraphidium curvatum]
MPRSRRGRALLGPQFAVAPRQPPPAGPSPSFSGRIDNVRSLAAVLRCIAFRPKCIVTASRSGLLFTVDDSRCAKACAYFQDALFRDYAFSEGAPQEPGTPAPDGAEAAEPPPQPELRFEINLPNLMECLNMYGTALAPLGPADGGGSGRHDRGGAPHQAKVIGVRISFDPETKKLVLTLADQNVNTTCRLATFDPDLNFANGEDAEPAVELDELFNAEPQELLHKIIMQSEYLQDAVKELDPTAEKVTFTVQPQGPQFRISAVGVTGSTEIDYSKDSDVMEKFHASGSSCFSYPINQILPALKALSQSVRTNIRTNKEGFLSMQHLIQISETQHSFVEFFVSPLEDDEDEEQDQGAFGAGGMAG